MGLIFFEKYFKKVLTYEVGDGNIYSGTGNKDSTEDKDMMNERDTNHKVMAEINGYTIIRSEARNFDKWTQEYSGQTKVYYDVCDEDENLLESFKTLREAKSFCA